MIGFLGCSVKTLDYVERLPATVYQIIRGQWVAVLTSASLASINIIAVKGQSPDITEVHWEASDIPKISLPDVHDIYPQTLG